MEESNEVGDEKEEGKEVEKGEGKKRRTKDSILQYIVSSFGYFVSRFHIKNTGQLTLFSSHFFWFEKNW